MWNLGVVLKELNLKFKHKNQVQVQNETLPRREAASRFELEFDSCT